MKFKVGDAAKCLVDIRGVTSHGKLIDGTDAPTVGDLLRITAILPSITERYPIRAAFKGADIGFREDELELVSTQAQSLSHGINHNQGLWEVFNESRKALDETIKPKTIPLTYHGVDTAHSPKCECGVDFIGGGRHSSYCPKAPYN